VLQILEGRIITALALQRIVGFFVVPEAGTVRGSSELGCNFLAAGGWLLNIVGEFGGHHPASVNLAPIDKALLSFN